MRFELNQQTNMLIQSYYINETNTYTPRDLTQIHIAPYIDLLWGRSTHNNNNKKCATDTDTKFVLVQTHTHHVLITLYTYCNLDAESVNLSVRLAPLSILGLLVRAMR